MKTTQNVKHTLRTIRGEKKRGGTCEGARIFAVLFTRSSPHPQTKIRENPKTDKALKKLKRLMRSVPVFAVPTFIGFLHVVLSLEVRVVPDPRS